MNHYNNVTLQVCWPCGSHTCVDAQSALSWAEKQSKKFSIVHIWAWSADHVGNVIGTIQNGIKSGEFFDTQFDTKKEKIDVIVKKKKVTE